MVWFKYMQGTKNDHKDLIKHLSLEIDELSATILKISHELMEKTSINQEGIALNSNQPIK